MTPELTSPLQASARKPSVAKRPLERGLTAQVSSSSSDHGSKLRGPSPNIPLVASKWDAKLTKPSFRATPARGRRLGNDVRFDVHQTHIQGGSWPVCGAGSIFPIQVESGFYPGALRPRSRDLTTKSPWPSYNITKTTGSL
ncbi:hypothetical protein AVEN_51571-1 [Araneus ventricosus]|uniref:Uncharacterized protein n=1 Tax=Araneus ventricosus TaxID=182803 RepID=A0A4Y2SNA2_ARAVE|nr:hypothetical protein AVEN_51571-1 [Araneus ventricosus]